MDDKIYSPVVIADIPFPQDPQTVQNATQTSTQEVHTPSTIPESSFPIPRVAVELLSSALNTRSKKIIQEFQFTPGGAIQVGKFDPGVSGDIRISPNGIVARDLSGNITFALDGDTGDAVFKGTVQSGSVITESFISGTIQLGGPNNEFGALEIFGQNGGPCLISNSLEFQLISDFDGGGLMFYADLSQSGGEINMAALRVGNDGSNGIAFGGSIEVYETGFLVCSINNDDGLLMGADRNIQLVGTLGTNPPFTTDGVVLGVDVSGGKHRLLAQFKTGAVQVLATEP